MLFLIFFGGALALPGASPLAQPDPQRGRDVYNFYCYYCHGYSGDGKTLASTMLSPAPRDFTRIDPAQWDARKLHASVSDGRPGTAMPSFSGRLDDSEIEDVLAFVETEFVRGESRNILYHSPENGWSSTQFDSPAADFVTGQISLSDAVSSLTPAQLQGRSIYLGSCVSCHDNVAAGELGPVWQSRAVSYPRGHYTHKDPSSATTGASPYSQHDQLPEIDGLSSQQLVGQRLYQANCAFCHAADGSGENWIGSFLEPKPRNLGGAAVGGMTDQQLVERIANGIPDTSMPSWRHVLSKDEIASIVGYIRIAFADRSSRFPESGN